MTMKEKALTNKDIQTRMGVDEKSSAPFLFRRIYTSINERDLIRYLKGEQNKWQVLWQNSRIMRKSGLNS